MQMSRRALTRARVGRGTKFCTWGEVPNVITHIKFDVDRFRDFHFLGVRNLGFSLTRPVALTNSVINTVMHLRYQRGHKCIQHGYEDSY